MAFLVGIQLARGLGVAGYGLYGSAMAAASLGASFASGGLQLHATRDLSAFRAQGDHGSAARLVGWSLRNGALLGGAAALAVGAYAYWGLGAPGLLIASAMAVTALSGLLILAGAIARGSGQLVLGQALDTAIRPTAQSGLLWIAVLALGSLDPALAMALTVAAILVTLPFGWRTVSRVWRSPTTSVTSPAERREWRKASTTMGLSTVIHAAEAAIPLIVVGSFSTLEQAGLFRVATAIMVFASLPITMITAMVPAMASSLYQQRDRAQLVRVAAACAALMVVPTLAIAGGLALFGEALLALAFGSDYRAAGPVVALLAGASLVYAMGGISISLLYAARHDAVVTRAFVVSLAVTCAGLVLAARDGSAVAFALAVLGGIAARTAFLIIATVRLVGIDPTIIGSLRWLVARRAGGAG